MLLLPLLSLLFLAPLCISGCEDEAPPPPPTPTPSAIKQESTGVKPGGDGAGKEVASKELDQAKTPPPYTYSSIGKRDPFRSYLAELAEEGREQTPMRRTEPTEDFELDQFRLTAIVTGTSQPRAMVEDPSLRGHVLRVGSRLGKHGGRVTRITSTGIVVTEETRDATGKRVRVRKGITLPRPEAGATLQ